MRTYQARFTTEEDALIGDCAAAFGRALLGTVTAIPVLIVGAGAVAFNVSRSVDPNCKTAAPMNEICPLCIGSLE
jgi:hypothetical protein